MVVGLQDGSHWLGSEEIGFVLQLRQITQEATIGAFLGGTNAIAQRLSERVDTQAR